MKNNIFKRSKGGDFGKNERLRKKVGKIVKTQENRRNFMPLFSPCKPQIWSEDERKSYLLEVAKKYFKVRDEIDDEKEII